MNTQPQPPPRPPSFGSQQMRAEFMLDPKYLALNHGSFGATPSKVFADRIAQMKMIETNPDHLVKVTFDGLLDKALVPVSCLLGLEGDLGSLVFTNNATTGLNAVLRSLKQILRSTGRYPKPTALKAQKILYFSTVYDKLLFAINYTCQNDGFAPLQIDIEYPISSEDLLSLVESTILNERANGNDIVMAVYDAITSLPAVITPFKELTELFRKYGILTCLDAAHAIGQIPFDLSEIKPDFCVTNLHKWLYVPRGCCVFYCSPKYHGVINHPVISELPPGNWRRSFHWYSLPPSYSSHGIHPTKIDKPRVGTNDISAFLTTHSALTFRAWIGGESAIQTYCHTLATRGAQIVATRLNTHVLQGPSSDPYLKGDNLYASMATIAVPETPFVTPLLMSKVSVFLTREQNCSVYPFKHAGRYWVRVSAQVYLNEGDFEKLAELLYRVFYGELAVE
ncbi:hypothetical protein HDU79_011277 [Rhizoclosmatium sp. JEL0117]|nr:hypothetical protein HDU79_011277 [Rhizoclosmatium sp. JEL0117]